MANAQFHSIQLNAKLGAFTSLSSDLEKFAELILRIVRVFSSYLHLTISFTFAHLVAYQLKGIKNFSLTRTLCLTKIQEL